MKSPCGQHVERKVSRRVMLRGLVYSALTLTGSVAYAQSDNLEIVRLDVPVKGLPPVLDGFSIGVMTDFHAGGWGNETVCSHAIASMQQLNPDLIALLGDYIDGARSHNRHILPTAGMFSSNWRCSKHHMGSMQYWAIMITGQTAKR